jgi:hopanoid biosynthesis associated radical SAM protein HpnH
MSVPISQMATVATYLIRQKLRGEKRYPLVLMLEPLYRCNLQCAGCGKIQYPSHVLKRQLSVDDCLAAVDACPAPMVSIPGGEPLLHPEIQEIVAGIIARRKYLYLCTNAILLEEKLDLFEPTRYLSFSVHLDGLQEEHDRAVCRDGIYDVAVSAIRAARARGFRVTTNTTLFSDADPERTAQFFDTAMDLGVEGLMVSPGYPYEKAPDQENFLERNRTVDFFRRVLSRPGAKRWRFNQSPLFIEFLAGAHDYDCVPWSMPAYSVFGWQKPCYLLQEGYAESYDELLSETRWADYGPKSGNPKCADCMVHCGYEAAAVQDAFSSPGGLVRILRAMVTGPQVPVLVPEEIPAAMDPQPVSSDHPVETQPARGWSAAASPESLHVAFDYRGDATLTLDDGARLEGYVVNANVDEVSLWEKGDPRPLVIPVKRIAHVTLSGRDTAAPTA